MKVIIAGTRTFTDYEKLSAFCDKVLSNQKEVEVVSGCSKGADLLGERYAKERGFSIKRFPADWNLYGKRAGPLRNSAMATYADALIAFWDGQSRGTQNMINLANAGGLKVRICEI